MLRFYLCFQGDWARGEKWRYYRSLLLEAVKLRNIEMFNEIIMLLGGEVPCYSSVEDRRSVGDVGDRYFISYVSGYYSFQRRRFLGGIPSVKSSPSFEGALSADSTFDCVSAPSPIHVETAWSQPRQSSSSTMATCLLFSSFVCLFLFI